MHRLHDVFCVFRLAEEGQNFRQKNLLFVTPVLSSSYDLRLSTSDNVISLPVFSIIMILLFVVLRVHRV